MPDSKMPEIIETVEGYYRIEKRPYESYEFFLERVRHLIKDPDTATRKTVETYFRPRL